MKHTKHISIPEIRALDGDSPPYYDGDNLVFKTRWKGAGKNRETVITALYSIRGVFDNIKVATERTLETLAIKGRSVDQIKKDLERLRSHAKILNKKADDGIDPRTVTLPRRSKSFRIPRQKTFGYWAIQWWRELQVTTKSHSPLKNYRYYLIEMIRRRWFFNVEVEQHNQALVLRMLREICDQPLNRGERYADTGMVNKAHAMVPILDRIYAFIRNNSGINFVADPVDQIIERLPPKILRGNPKITTDYELLGECLLDIDEYYQWACTLGLGSQQPKLGKSQGNVLRLHPYTLMRGQQVPTLRWEWVNFETLEISKPQEKVLSKKRKNESNQIYWFYVPITSQMLEILVDQAEYSYGKSEWVFPLPYDFSKPVAKACQSQFYRNFKNRKWSLIQSSHGWRGSAETIMKDELKIDKEIIQLQLSHLTQDKFGGAYDNAFKLPERRMALQHWGDWLDMVRDFTRDGRAIPRRRHEESDIAIPDSTLARLRKLNAI